MTAAPPTVGAPGYATRDEFVAACRFWQQNGAAPLGFADWLDEQELFGQGAGWRFAARGYSGCGPELKIVPCNGVWVLHANRMAAAIPEGVQARVGSVPTTTRHHEVVARFLDAWAVAGLSAEQLEATRTILGSTEQVRTLGGYAGTGKTRVLLHLHAALPDYAVVSFTGKAVDNLRRLGIRHANTIHSTIYSREGTEPNVRWVPKSRWAVGMNWPRQVNGFLIDEASMVAKKEFDQLVSYGLPIIAVGDHGQLPPVGDDAGLMLEPMVRLETVFDEGKRDLWQQSRWNYTAASRARTALIWCM